VCYAQTTDMNGDCRGPGVGSTNVSAVPICDFYNSSFPGRKWSVYNLRKQGAYTTWDCKESTGSIVSGGSCSGTVPTCNAGEAPPGADEGSWSVGGRIGGKTACIGNCVATGTNDGSVGVGVGAGAVETTTFFRNMKQTGAMCDSKKDQDSGNPDKKCGPDEGTATVNGKTKCLPKKPDGTDTDPKKSIPKTTTETNEKTESDGTKTVTETTTKTVTGGDGITRTTTTTTTKKIGLDGVPQVVGTETKTKEEDKGTQDGDGTDDEDDGKDDEPSDFCKKNPSLNICKNSSVTGSCEEIQCTGDAIQCSILKTQQKQDCELRRETVYQKLGQNIAEGNDPDKHTLPTIANAQQVDLSATQLDANGWGMGGACFSDKTFSVGGKVFTIPFSSVCEYLLALRYGIMLLASILSFKIVTGAVLTA